MITKMIVSIYYLLTEYAFRTMLLLTEFEVHTRKGNICSDIQGVWTERSEVLRLECQNKYFPYGPKSRLIRALLYTYTNKKTIR